MPYNNDLSTWVFLHQAAQAHPHAPLQNIPLLRHRHCLVLHWLPLSLHPHIVSSKHCTGSLVKAGGQAFHPSFANHNWLVRATVDGSLVTVSKPSFDSGPSWGAETRHPELVVKYPHWLSLSETGHSELHGLKCWSFLDHKVCRKTVLLKIE